MRHLIRFGYSRTSSAGSYSIAADQCLTHADALVADVDIVNAYYYPRPGAAPVWVKGDAASHARLTDSINTLSR